MDGRYSWIRDSAAEVELIVPCAAERKQIFFQSGLMADLLVQSEVLITISLIPYRASMHRK
jgi:hypothetical protein